MAQSGLRRPRCVHDVAAVRSQTQIAPRGPALYRARAPRRISARFTLNRHRPGLVEARRGSTTLTTLSDQSKGAVPVQAIEFDRDLVEVLQERIRPEVYGRHSPP